MLQQTLEWLQNLGFWAPIIFILIYIIATVFLISGAILTLGAGAIFGLLEGLIYVSLASTLGAAIAFLIGRYLARGWVSKQIDQKPKFKAIDSAVAQQGWKIVGLTRLSPLFPFVFLNYAFSITKVSLRDYVLASWLGMLPGTVMYVYIGSLAKDLASLGTTTAETDNLVWILRIIGFIATVAVTIYITRIAKQALDSQIDQVE
ncbi:MAG: TVP38/TMEM64 family protein [Gloeocapsa sp. DLM2.Bin57]|nr:MAG: TVP38/TMEM64 family protein [Gloeocapsa sp. DLM2.Bin57]